MKTALIVICGMIGLLGAGWICVWWGLVLPLAEIINSFSSKSEADPSIVSWAIAKIVSREFLGLLWLLVWFFVIGFIGDKE